MHAQEVPRRRALAERLSRLQNAKLPGRARAFAQANRSAMPEGTAASALQYDRLRLRLMAARRRMHWHLGEDNRAQGAVVALGA
jgi:hypothetical protein